MIKTEIQTNGSHINIITLILLLTDIFLILLFALFTQYRQAKLKCSIQGFTLSIELLKKLSFQ